MKQRTQPPSSLPDLVPGHDAELEYAMRGFFALSAKDQRRAFVQIRDFLGAAAPAETDADRAVAEQVEALDVLARVAAHLNLPQGEVPTVTAFDAVCRELQLSWTRSRVIRAWGRWRTACAAFSEGHVPLTAKQVAYHHRFRGRLTHHRPALTALRCFLESDSPKQRRRDYDRWVREQNDRLPHGDQLFPASPTLLYQLGVIWIDALRVARGEVELSELPKREPLRYESWVSGPHDLVSLSAVVDVFGVSKQEAAARAREEEFPTPVVIIGSTRGWLRSDIEAYAAGEPFPTRQENELRHLYVDARELSRLVGLTPIALTPRPKPTFPPHSGRLSTTRYWLRSDVDRWIAANRGLVSKRLRQQSQRPREDVELKKLITLFDIEALFNLDPRTAGRLIAERGFPDPIAHIGHTAIWMRSQVDAYLTGQSPNEPAIDADEVVGSRELSEMSGLPLTSVRSLRGVPPPAGKAGRKTYWWRRDIEKWLAARGEG